MNDGAPDVAKNYVELFLEFIKDPPIMAIILLIVIIGFALKVKPKRRKSRYSRYSRKSHRGPSKNMDFSQLVEYFQHRKTNKQIHELTAQTKEIDIDTFFRMRQRTMKSYKRSSTRPSTSFTGVYILHNTTKGQYYVGQGKSTIDRVNQHFTGKGNGDIYVDYRNGDKWSISMINFSDTPFDTLNELERHTIKAYDAFRNGYNRTRGNQ